MRRPAAIVPIGGFAVLLAACGGIPSASAPVPADELAADGLAPPPVIGDRPPPAAGAAPREIVEGFLSAMEQYTSRETAREYLAGEAASGWEPLSEILIFQGEPAIEISDAVATIEVTIEATYDRMDGFVRHPPGSTGTFRFAMEQIDDEWRLTEAPDGLMISSSRFESDFEPYNLYYYDKSFTALVPDPVYLPRTALNQETLLVEALLAGPSEWLAPAVRTAVPAGTTLVSVPLTDGSAVGAREVKLSDAAVVQPDGSATSAERRELLVAQLARTLGELRSVNEVAVTAGATRLSGTEDDPFVGVEDAGGSVIADRLYVVTESGVGLVEAPTNGVEPVDGPLADHAGLREVAVDQRHSRAAAITEDYGIVMAGLRGTDTEVTPVLPGGGDFESLAWDSSGLLWTIERPSGTAGDEPADPAEAGEAEEKGDSGSRLLVSDPDTDEPPVDVTPSTPGGADVEQFAISPDGTRIAMVIDGNIHLGIVVRDPARPQDPSAVAVEGLRRVYFEFLADPVGGVDWYGSDRLALLSAPEPVAPEEPEAGSDEPAPPEAPDPTAYVAPLSQLHALQNRVIVNGESISASSVQDRNVQHRMAVGASDGSVWIQSETQRWEVMEDIAAPAFSD